MGKNVSKIFVVDEVIKDVALIIYAEKINNFCSEDYLYTLATVF